MITFFKSRNIESRAKVEPATGQYIGRYRTGLDVVAQTHYQLVAASIVEANSTTTVINCTNHLARVGDAISITSGALSGDRVFVQSTTTNSITLSQTLASAPIAGVTFDILRPALPRTGSSGSGAVDLVAVGGAAVTLGQKVEASSIPVVLATEQDTAILDVASGLRANLVAATITDFDGTTTMAWPGIGSSFSGFYPGVGLAAQDTTSASMFVLKAVTTAPNVGDVGLVVRNIPSGTQNMRGVSLVASAPVRISCSTGTTLLAANANRRKFIITNFNTQFIYWKLGTGCSSTSYSGVIAPYTSYESFVDDATEIITIATQFGSVFVGGQEFT